MAVTTAQIRDLLNRPRGLTEGTISEYITIRTAEVAKKARITGYVGVTANAPTDALKDSAIKMMVCVDCLRVLVDTIHTIVPEKEKGAADIRFAAQLKSFEKSALEAMRAIEEKGGTAFKVKSTTTRVGGTTGTQLSGNLHTL
tara:strand:- start:1111 stop:1539 length:429 start_codon:yes stop_codon:yes gene_type:complete